MRVQVSPAVGNEKVSQMDREKYGRERAIRGWYRRVGRRRTYIQRRIYERRLAHSENRDRRTRGEKRTSLFDEEDLVSLTSSTSFGRSRFLSQRRRVGLRWRTRKPGRFRHELRQRERTRRRRLGLGTRRTWKWYESDVDVNRIDRRRSRSFFVPLFWRKLRRGKSTETLKSDQGLGRREDRGIRRWRGGRRYRLRIPERAEWSKRRSRRRRGGGYLVCVERWRRREYRGKGRIRGKRKEKSS
jgi:hypothetical protein